MNDKRQHPLENPPAPDRSLVPEMLPASYLLRWQMPAAAGGLTLQGYSRAADGTGFVIPELDCVFDAGVMASEARHEHIFVSHTHTDHVHWLTHLKSRRKPPQIHLPAHAVPLVDRFLIASQELTNNRPRDPDEEWTVAYHLNGVVPGDVIELKRGGRRLSVEVLSCDHTVPCVGYAFYEHKRKLKPAFAGLSSNEIAQRKREGVEITEDKRLPLFAYLGDTTEEVFVRHPGLLEMPVVITECSFFDADEHDERARKTRHMLWERLAPYVAQAPETTFVLIHFSHRYQEADVHAFFQEVDADNLVLWLPPPQEHL